MSQTLPESRPWYDEIGRLNAFKTPGDRIVRTWEERRDFEEAGDRKVLQDNQILELRRRVIRNGVKVLADVVFDTTISEALKQVYALSGWTPARYHRLLHMPSDCVEFAEWCALVEAVEVAVGRYPMDHNDQHGDGPATLEATDREILLAMQRLARLRAANAKISEQKTVGQRET